MGPTLIRPRFGQTSNKPSPVAVKGGYRATAHVGALSAERDEATAPSAAVD